MKLEDILSEDGEGTTSAGNFAHTDGAGGLGKEDEELKKRAQERIKRLEQRRGEKIGRR